mmetsp:Transcript_3278/g.13482  ORF Transcript_3278/g.13482 Transcript_3278/m.13482 type:complete len:296 (-) Transcript_3278:251-1138(-)
MVARCVCDTSCSSTSSLWFWRMSRMAASGHGTTPSPRAPGGPPLAVKHCIPLLAPLGVQHLALPSSEQRMMASRWCCAPARTAQAGTPSAGTGPNPLDAASSSSPSALASSSSLWPSESGPEGASSPSAPESPSPTPAAASSPSSDWLGRANSALGSAESRGWLPAPAPAPPAPRRVEERETGVREPAGLGAPSVRLDAPGLPAMGSGSPTDHVRASIHLERLSSDREAKCMSPSAEWITKGNTCTAEDRPGHLALNEGRLRRLTEASRVIWKRGTASSLARLYRNTLADGLSVA